MIKTIYDSIQQMLEDGMKWGKIYEKYSHYYRSIHVMKKSFVREQAKQRIKWWIISKNQRRVIAELPKTDWLIPAIVIVLFIDSTTLMFVLNLFLGGFLDCKVI